MLKLFSTRKYRSRGVKGNVLLFLLLLLWSPSEDNGFKEEQLKHSRVRKAYEDKEDAVKKLLSKKGVALEELRVHLRAYKAEKVLELWGKEKGDTTYRKLRDYDICALSGGYGPKRQQGDRQIPEGFYHIDRFNPYSDYHLSLGINYPNPSDKVLGVEGDLGGQIFIHGDCVTIGCIPITDPRIEELYIFCVEAKDKGQEEIPVRIFPGRMNELIYEKLLYRYEGQDPPKALWKDLLKADRRFRRSGQLPELRFSDNGRHHIQE